MENLSIVHHMLIFEYTQMTSATEFIAAMEVCSNSHRTSIVNVGAGAASLSFVNTTSLASLSVEKSFVYRARGIAMSHPGNGGSFAPHRNSDVRLQSWVGGVLGRVKITSGVAASFEGTWGVCEFYTDWDAFVIRGDNNISDKDVVKE